MASSAQDIRPKIRSGQHQETSIVCWSAEDEALALGFVQILDENGNAQSTDIPNLDPKDHRRLYLGMLQSRRLDERLMALQRQGRISHYFEARGQEAAVIAAAYVLDAKDYFVPGLREGTAALFRGMPLETYLAQILGTRDDGAHGRQMPCHPSSAALRHVSTSSCVATQIPHAVGLGWAAKIRKESVITLCFFGDGATSEDDFHAGMNFAAVNQVPVVFVCQNNQWAISTPVAAQTQADTLAAKGLTYGIKSIRVDGNDILALLATLREAVTRARTGQGPTFIESVTYRLGAHASADEPSLYREEEENRRWQKKDPISRYATWLAQNGILSTNEGKSLLENLDHEIQDAIEKAEQSGPPPVASLFEDVTAQPTWHLYEQKADFLRQRTR
jgi:TPP-dependent pyruvate/acetoin dehydrogenase alpha subunit